MEQKKFWNPYLAGVALGLVLLSAYLLLGRGLGASGAVNRIGVAALMTIAPDHVASNSAMHHLGIAPLDHWMVFMLLGAFLGGLVSSFTAGRFKLAVFKGPRISTSTRLILATSGGVLMGIAARIARGCTSGQALTGGALMSVGSWAFMLSVFAGGYALAWFVRRQWL